MSSTSWKKAIKSARRDYQERHQPEARKHLGLLEKKKDYRLRSKAYHDKQNKLKKLYRKARNKNPDEFCFHMINSEMQDGLNYEKEKPEQHTEAQIKLLQSRDYNYVNFKLGTEIKKIEKLKSAVALLNVPDRPKNTHTFYVDSKADAKKFDVVKQLKTHPDLLDRPYNRPTLDALKTMKLGNAFDKNTLEKMSKQVCQQYNELSKRIERAQELSVVRQKFEIKKKLANKNEPEAKLIKEATKTSAPIYLWKKERKR